MDPSFDRWFVTPAPRANPRCRVFCVPYAGGSATAYRRWADAFPRTVETRTVQFPGRQKRIDEPRLRRMPEAVEAIADAIAGATDIPYVVFGDCTGALVALELCRRLRRQRLPGPRHLLVACCRAPHLPLKGAPLHTLDDDMMREELVRFGLAPSWLLESDEYCRAFLPVLRDDFELAETYSYTTDDPLDIPITAFGGSNDPVTGIDDVRGWQRHTSARFDLKVISGGHDLTTTHAIRLIDEVACTLDPLIADSTGVAT